MLAATLPSGSGPRYEDFAGLTTAPRSPSARRGWLPSPDSTTVDNGQRPPRLLELPIHSRNRNSVETRRGLVLHGTPGPHSGAIGGIVSDGRHHEPVWWNGDRATTPEAAGLPSHVTSLCDFPDASYIAVWHGLDVVHTMRKADFDHGIQPNGPHLRVADWLTQTETVVSWDGACGNIAANAHTAWAAPVLRALTAVDSQIGIPLTTIVAFGGMRREELRRDEIQLPLLHATHGDGDGARIYAVAVVTADALSWAVARSEAARGRVRAVNRRALGNVHGALRGASGQ